MEKTQYAKARVFVRIIAGFGWFLIALGVVGFFASFINAAPFNLALSLNVLTKIYAVVFGVFMLAGSQLLKAVLDTADNTREILVELRKQNRD